MRKLCLFSIVSIVSILFVGCSTTYKISKIGDLTMASTRNIDKDANYEELKTYAGVSSLDVNVSSNGTGTVKSNSPIAKKIEEFQANSLEDAMNKVVRSTPGGEYLKNLVIYSVDGTSSSSSSVSLGSSENADEETTRKYVVTGDVWGEGGGNQGIKGFYKGDKVVFTYTRNLRKEENLRKTEFDGEINNQYKGKIIKLKGSSAKVQVKNDIIIEIPYSDLTNLDN